MDQWIISVENVLGDGIDTERPFFQYLCKATRGREAKNSSEIISLNYNTYNTFQGKSVLKEHLNEKFEAFFLSMHMISFHNCLSSALLNITTPISDKLE